MDLGTLGWVVLAVGTTLLLARSLIDPSKPGRPGGFTPEVRRARMMVVGIGSIILGLTMLLTDQCFPLMYSGSPFHDRSDYTNPNRLLGISILWLMFFTLLGWQGITIVRSREKMVANQRRNPDLVQPINITKKERWLQVMGWVFIVAAGGGFLWTIIGWISGIRD
jgi:hypothetical protein